MYVHVQYSKKEEEMEYMYTVFTLQKKYMYMYMCSDIESILELIFIDKMYIKHVHCNQILSVLY